MLEPARIVFYDIEEFGFYKRGSETPLFGAIPDILNDLATWANGRQLGLTKTYDRDDGSLLPAYFLDARRRGSAWLLTLWNETPNTDGTVASINAYDQVGNVDVTLTELAAGDIPGFASYFWFLPDRNVVATIRFQHSAARSQMRTYLQKFMANFCSHAVTETNEATQEIRVLGYRATRTSPLVKARARFNLDLHRRSGEQQYLLEHADRVRKLSKKGILTLTERQDRALWQRMLTAAHLTEPSIRPQEVKIRYDVEVEDGLTEDEVSAIINGWDEESDDNDFGFRMVGETETRWLGHAIAKESLSLDVLRLNPEMVDPEFLLEELARHRAELVRLLA